MDNELSLILLNLVHLQHKSYTDLKTFELNINYKIADI